MAEKQCGAASYVNLITVCPWSLEKASQKNEVKTTHLGSVITVS